jgi:general secretion pathway protein K
VPLVIGERMARRSDEGIALIAVLWVLILLSIVAASVSHETHTDASVGRNIVDIAMARAAADAGIKRAILDLVSVANPKGFRADGTIYAWRFASSTVQISIRNEGTKIDLNHAPETSLSALFASVGVDASKAQSLADAVADFRDSDNFPRRHGAEAPEYVAAGLAWGPKNAPFEAVEELEQVLGMSPRVYERVAPYLTTYDPPAPTMFAEPAEVYSIRAAAKCAQGATFVRAAIVQLEAGNSQILSWRQLE